MNKIYKKRRIRLLTGLVLVIMAFFLYRLGSYGYRLYSLNNAKKELTIQYNDLRKQEKDLKVEIEKLKNDEYLAKYVREKYKYSKDGELVLSVDETKKVIDQMDKDINQSKIVLITSVTIFGMVILYVIFKKKR